MRGSKSLLRPLVAALALATLGCGSGGGTPAPTCTVVFVAGTGGSLTGVTPQTLASGASTTPVTAVPATGFTFTNWSGSGFTTTTSNPVTVANVTSDMTLTATFAPQTFTVTFLAGTGGTLTGTTTQTVAFGGSATPVTAVPATGHAFTSWTGAGFTTTTANPVTVANVTSDMTLTATFAPQTFTVTFQAGTGGTLAGTLTQVLAYGDSTSAVTATPDPGYAFSRWSSPGLPDSVANPVTVLNVTQDLTLTASFTPLFPDLATWLGSNPAVAAAIKWQFQPPAGGNAYTPPGSADMIAWTDWSPSQKSDLEAAYIDAALWLSQGATAPITLPYRGVSDAPTNYYGNQADSSTAMQFMIPSDMWKVYVAHVAFSLALETSGKVPWTLTSYDAASLRYLLDSSSMGWMLNQNVVVTEPYVFSLGTYGGANLPALRVNTRPKTPFAHPMWIYQWMGQAGIVGPTRLASIGGVLDWMRHNLTHFYGADTFGTCAAVWQYKGYPPLSRIIQGTVDANNPGLGVMHWTLGCHGSVGFLAATLRALNIPVEPVWVGGHELACFPTERLYLDHGDDPYNSVVRVDHPASPILKVLIDEATYQTRFTTDLTVNLNNPSAAVLANIGKAAADFQ